MGKIVDFPSRNAQGMAFLEAEIRKLMASKGESEAATQIALDTLKDVYTRYGDIGKKSISIKLPAGLSDHQTNAIQQEISAAIQHIIEEHSHIINRLAAELVLTKVKLYQATLAQNQKE